MVFKKRKIEEEEEHETDTKYTPGKHPRTQASLPRVDYESPLDQRMSCLWRSGIYQRLITT